MQRAVYPIVPPITNAHMGGCPRLAATASDGPIQPSTTAAANAACLVYRCESQGGQMVPLCRPSPPFSPLMATQVVRALGRQRRQELAVCYSHLQIEQITVYQVRDFSLTAYQLTAPP